MKSIVVFLKNEVDSNRTPSIQYAFFDSDSLIYEFQYGFNDLKAKKKTEASDTYNLFSVTKTFTALAVLQLAQQGKLHLHEPVINYLPDFPYSKQITVEQLLNHSSGIPNPLPLKWTHLTTEHDSFNRDLFFSSILENNKLKSVPGTRFSYSNLGYVILGQLIEKVTGKKYETYIKENILDKAGITGNELSFTIDNAVHAKGYQKYWSFTNGLLGFLIDKKKYMGPAEGKWKPFHFFYINGTPYGGMIGSATGLIKYAQALLRSNDDLLNEDYKKILFTESVINHKPTGMSLSWFTGNVKGNNYFTHAGGGGGYYIELRIYPESGTGSVILFNRSGMTDERILDKADRFFLVEKNV